MHARLKLLALTWLATLTVGCIDRASQGAPPPKSSDVAAGARQIEVTMSPFKFEPAEFTLRRGEPVAFVVKNAGGVHTFTVAELNLDLVLQETQSATTPVVIPSRDGEFRLVCRFHEFSGMVGTLRVGAEAATGAKPALGAAPAEVVAARPRAESLRAQAGERPTDLQELAEIENYAASRFYPARFVVRKDLPVRLYITRLHREHVNNFTISPFVTSTAFFAPGTMGSVDFTPAQSGEFMIVNEGHGYQAPLIVVETAEEARTQLIQSGVQELALIHDFRSGQVAPQRVVVQQGVPVRLYTTGLGGQDKVAIPPFYFPTGVNVEPGKITSLDFTPTEAGEFTLTYEQHSLTATLVVEARP